MAIPQQLRSVNVTDAITTFETEIGTLTLVPSYASESEENDLEEDFHIVENEDMLERVIQLFTDKKETLNIQVSQKEQAQEKTKLDISALPKNLKKHKNAKQIKENKSQLERKMLRVSQKIVSLKQEISAIDTKIDEASTKLKALQADPDEIQKPRSSWSEFWLFKA